VKDAVIHLTDARKAEGIACNNPRARGAAVPWPDRVTCQACLRAVRRRQG